MFFTVRRFAAIAALAALCVAISTAPALADTAPAGVGSTEGSSALVTIDVGDLLHVGLLGDTGNGTIDPAKGTPIANETFSPLSISSGVLPALNALSAPALATSSTGAPDQKSAPLIDLTSLPQPIPVLDGTINAATLSSAVDTTGAQTSLASTLANVGVLGGIARLDSGGLNLNGVAGPSASTVNRTASLDALTVLDLRSLLNLLGIDLDMLSTGQLTGLIGQLGLLDALNSAVPGLGATSITDLDTTISTLVSNLGDLLNIAVCTGTEPILLLLGINCSQLTSTITGITDQLTAVLQGVLDTLDGAALLRIEGVQAGAVATAAGTVGDSVAKVTAGIGKILVGGIDLGGIDANTTIAQVQSLAATATAQINSILGAISPSLANVISINLFEQNTNVNTSNGYVNALAAVNALRVTITPPDVCAVLSDLANLSLPDVPLQLPASPVAGLLSGLGSTVDCSNILPQINSLVPAALPADLSAVNALVDPVTIEVASISSSSNFTTPAAPPPATTTEPTPLARTGMNELTLLLAGGLLALVAVTTRRVLARARA